MTLTDINVESKTSASEHIRVFRVFRGQKKRETDLSDLSEINREKIIVPAIRKIR